MSRVARDWAWALAVTPVQKLVLIALAERADEQGRCFPSLVHLVQMTGLARSTLTVALQELETAHRIVRLRGGGRKSTRYQLLVAEPGAVAMGTRVGPPAAADPPDAHPGITTKDRLDGPSRARVLPGPDSGASKARGARDTNPSSPGSEHQQSDSRTGTALEANPSGPGSGLQQYGGRTAAVPEIDPCSPRDGPVREAVVRSADTCGPGVGPQRSGDRTAAVRETDPNRQDNRHITVSEPTADVVDAQRQDRRAKDAPKSTPIPADWRPGERVFDWATKQGMTRDWVEAQIDEFVVYWTDTREARKSWDATFINRLQALQSKQPKEQADDPEPRLSEKDYLTGATPRDRIPWLKPAAVR